MSSSDSDNIVHVTSCRGGSKKVRAPMPDSSSDDDVQMPPKPKHTSKPAPKVTAASKGAKTKPNAKKRQVVIAEEQYDSSSSSSDDEPAPPRKVSKKQSSKKRSPSSSSDDAPPRKSRKRSDDREPCRRVGTKEEVFNGEARQTAGGLTKADLLQNAQGRVVSKKASEAARSKIAQLVKSGGKPFAKRTAAAEPESSGSDD